MIENFFADYKNYIVVPEDEKQVGNEVFDPKNFEAYYILTLSIFDSRLSTWKDASKFEIDVEKSIKIVLRDFNQTERKKYHLQLLEFDKYKNYFILALSSKTKFNPGEEKDRINDLIDKKVTNPFYVGQNWFNLIGDKGRVARKLFCCSFKEYMAQDLNHLKREEKYENISEFIPKKGEMKLIKSSLKKDIL
ncbi:hypothetical protein J7E79_23825 [Bacillus sp. ISL-40]|uniref:hypothetical protein n=1 Tax=unclassified Bacillus (in: firmicutes) TaxID=185979 RepID=UPI001BEA86D8|nr:MULTISPECIES: hypothetical protein [unclassified Bacillus (in: firmicutes)]MBT2700392.1 hypothetical protein [Bacillus sp. ISL-40]MBT2724942.1 hypothetical protein [Bacillus sp. ISL-46]MBT2741680.1 hypothetical protein [Bacillus sp. ISL-77]